LYSYCGGYPLRYLDPLGLLIAPPPPVAVNPYLGTFVIGVGIGSIAGKPFWDWCYAPEPWNPVLRPPVPLPVPAPKGDFDPHPHDENFPKDCYDIYISDMDFCAWLFEACMEGCENEEFCDELAKECEDKAVNTLIDCSGESPDWDPKLPDKPPPPPPWEKWSFGFY